jgi:hypothetical protein
MDRPHGSVFNDSMNEDMQPTTPTSVAEMLTKASGDEVAP